MDRQHPGGNAIKKLGKY